MSRRVIAFLLALVMASCLIGCGSKATDTTSDNKKEESSEKSDVNASDEKNKEEAPKETQRRLIRYVVAERWESQDEVYEGYEEGTYKYDSNGNIVEESYIRKDVDDHVEETYYYTYDANNNLIKEECVEPGEGTTVLLFTYDANNNLIKEERVYPSGGSFIKLFTYDAEGRLLTEDHGGGAKQISYSYYPNGVLQMEYLTEGFYYYKTLYNERGDVIYTENRIFSGQIYISEYTYDGQGKLLKEQKTQSDRPYVAETTYSYDANGNLLLKEYSDGNGYTRTTSYTYDANGVLRQENEDAISSSYTSTSTTIYDSNGNKLTYSGREEYQATWYSDAGINTFLYSFTYDAQGNKLTETSNYIGGGYGHTVYTYDSEGTLLSEVTTGWDSDGNPEVYTTTYTYEYEEF